MESPFKLYCKARNILNNRFKKVRAEVKGLAGLLYCIPTYHFGPVKIPLSKMQDPTNVGEVISVGTKLTL